ncbi:MAG TPA: ABC transporter ATP-binding protein [Candidatus Polarisedimenticolia bacterium]|nr:ABC transporter ATP-binding protein [Candidatus Polarisedimenticolia bacterium]
MNPTPAIQAEKLGKIYVKRRSLREMALRPFRGPERVTGLSDVTLQIDTGEIFGLLGPNGAGKTTLLKILACLVLPTDGRARVEGIDVARDDRAVKRAIGFASADERSFYWRLTGRENLIFFGRLYGLDPAAAARRVADLIEAIDLGDSADQQFMSLSSGMRQRLAIARALLHSPRLLCLDEPTRSLDPIAAKHLRRFIATTLNRERGMTILLATHNLQEAEEICGRVAILHHGRVLRQGRVGEITAGLPGKDQYLLSIRGLEAPLPRDGRWEIADGISENGVLRVGAAVERGGEALSDLLRAILERRGTILSCNRREPGLQEIFDRLEEAG